MPRVKMKFESYSLLLLYSCDRNWPGYFMLLALGFVCDSKEVWKRRARYFKLPSLAVASRPRDNYARGSSALK